jgi:GMP synthase-like glutamine amidotransferase
MKPVRIFRHVTCEGPGYVSAVLDRHQVPHELVAIDQGAAVPAGIDEVSGLVCMGGPMSVNDPLPWIEQELGQIRAAMARGLPVLGICLGSQLMVRALDSKVYPGGKGMELGWRPVQRHPAADNSPWLSGLPASFDVFHWHGETFDLPAGADLLLGNDCFTHQAFAIGNSLALQFHVEIQADMVHEWIELNPDDIANGRDCGQSASEMLLNLDARVEQLQQVANVMLGQWVRGLEG